MHILKLPKWRNGVNHQLLKMNYSNWWNKLLKVLTNNLSTQSAYNTITLEYRNDILNSISFIFLMQRTYNINFNNTTFQDFPFGFGAG